MHTQAKAGIKENLTTTVLLCLSNFLVGNFGPFSFKLRQNCLVLLFLSLFISRHQHITLFFLFDEVIASGSDSTSGFPCYIDLSRSFLVFVSCSTLVQSFLVQYRLLVLI